MATKAELIYPRDSVVIREVGLRDGLQLVKQFPSTEAKRRWIEIDYAAGVRHFEAGSYLPAQAFPQFVDVDEMVDFVNSLPGAFASVLVLNKRGAERALQGNAADITCVLSASEEHNLRNARRTREASVQELAEVIAMRDDTDRKPIITVGIAMSFGCSIQGPISVDEVARIAERCASLGVDAIGLADTVGYGGPKQVKEVIRAARKGAGNIPFAIHLHDTRGTGIANAAAALDEGVRILDGSLAGLGGCPFAPRATGNVVLEDLVYLCQTMGYPVPISIEGLMPARDVVASAMPEETLYGALAKAGLPLGFVQPAKAARAMAPA